VDRLALMQAFVAVAEATGFAQAARRLGVSPPVITRAVAALEEHLGARLFERTTRQVRITEAGARYLVDCKKLLGELDDAEAAVRGAHSEASGQLGVTASVMFGRLFVAKLLLDFQAQHPAVTVRALLVDHVVDLLEEGLDVAVRIAHLADSSFAAARVGQVRRVLVAAPSYIERHGVPKTPRDLSDHQCLVFSTDRMTPPWSFERDAKAYTHRPRGTLIVNSSEVAIQAAVTGAGVTRALSYMVAADVAAGRLCILLEDFEPEPIPIHVLHREGRRAPARVRAFVDFAVTRLRADPAVNPRGR
jgi:DNA-binding transcriptional LysR family regulator